MRPVEVDTVLAVLAAAYPEKTLTEEETSTWERHLESVDFDVAVAAAEAIIDHQKWFPKISELRHVAEPIARRRLESSRPSLTPAVQDRATDKKRGLAHIAELRAQLRKESA